jgi:Spy/CpxP family protein refolding chaperone
MKRGILITALGATAFLLLSGFGGFGRPTPERIKRYADLRIDDQLDDLKATPEQKQKVHAQVDALFPEAVALYQDHQRAKVEATDLLEQDKVDAARLHGLVDARIDALRGFAHKAVDAVISVHDTLNPAQRAELVQKARERQREELSK